MNQIRIVSMAFLFLMFVTPSFSNTEQYEFTSKYIDGLQHLAINFEKAQDIKNDDSDDQRQMAIDLLTESRLAGDRLKSAKFLIEDFFDSQNDFVKEAAVMVVAVYEAQILNNEKYLKFFEDLIAHPDQYDEGKYIVEMAKINADSERGWEMLNDASVLVTYLLVDQNPDKDGNLSYLILTRKERQDLISKLDGIYGDSIKDGLMAGQNKFQACGGILKEFLSGEYRSADDPR